MGLKQFLVNLWFRYRKKWGWFGHYDSFEAAAADCQGYDDAAILARVRTAALAVKTGQAAYERDGVLFQSPDYLPFMRESLQKIADTEGGLRVLDFGGSLGSTYFQYRSIFGNAVQTWCVVEQAHFVSVGQQELAEGPLSFEGSIAAAQAKHRFNVVLLSSVLQYLPTPYDWLESLLALGARYVLVDKTPFLPQGQRITQQIVPPAIYTASYPCWILDLQAFKAFFSKYNYYLEKENTNTDTINILEARFKGFLFSLK